MKDTDIIICLKKRNKYQKKYRGANKIRQF